MNEQNTVEEHLRTLSGRKLEYRRIVTNDELKKTKKKDWSIYEGGRKSA